MAKRAKVEPNEAEFNQWRANYWAQYASEETWNKKELRMKINLSGLIVVTLDDKEIYRGENFADAAIEWGEYV